MSYFYLITITSKATGKVVWSGEVPVDKEHWVTMPWDEISRLATGEYVLESAQGSWPVEVRP